MDSAASAGVAVNVRPANLYYLLCYASRRLEALEFLPAGADQITDATELFARVLLPEARRLIAHRLDLGYLAVTDEMRTPRGRLRLEPTLARGLLAQGRVACTFEEQSEDVVHNRILKTALAWLEASPTISPETRNALAGVLARMTHVSPLAPGPSTFRSLQLHANLRRYAHAMRVCQFVLERVVPTEEPGAYSFRAFSGDEREFGALFEGFLRGWFQAHVEETGRARVKSSRYVWRIDGEGNGLFPNLQTDICLETRKHRVILEAKCYREPLVTSRHGGGVTLRPGHVFQLHGYLNSAPQDGREARGVLVYAVDRPRVPPTRVSLNGFPFFVREIDLSRPWGEIHQALEDLFNTCTLETRDGESGMPESRYASSSSSS